MIHRQVEAGERVVVLTVCAGDPPPGPLSAFALSLHQRWSQATIAGATPRETVAARRAEDLAALEALGAEAIHLAIPDCIYRAHPESGVHLYASMEALFGRIHQSETALIERLSEELVSVRGQMLDGFIYAPLGLGGHVDHQLTRQAAERAGGVTAYFEDYPYAGQLSAIAPEGMRPDRIWLAPDDIGAKVRAVSAYSSQISSFWPSLSEMEDAVREFAERTGGGRPAERLWRAR
jgi:LmbE family N-acetylglucosaminyl deacetylase